MGIRRSRSGLEQSKRANLDLLDRWTQRLEVVKVHWTKLRVRGNESLHRRRIADDGDNPIGVLLGERRQLDGECSFAAKVFVYRPRLCRGQRKCTRSALVEADFDRKSVQASDALLCKTSGRWVVPSRFCRLHSSWSSAVRRVSRRPGKSCVPCSVTVAVCFVGSPRPESSTGLAENLRRSGGDARAEGVARKPRSKSR